ncbi:hypothetical protein DFH06DRAFT_189011 [Mycena polygramma]|nr:hypothetical protein DFH06DRAFT_189011 [Mycena polygramma]
MAGRFLSVIRNNVDLGRYTTKLSLQPNVPFFYSDFRDLLPNVHTMIMTAFIFGPLPGSPHPWLSVTRLQLRFGVLSTAEHLGHLIGLFPALERLEFAGWMTPSTPEPLTEIVTDVRSLHLKQLVLGAERQHSSHPAALQLALHDITADSFSVTVDAGDCDATPCNMLLAKLGPTLRNLQVVELPDGFSPFVSINLSPCCALQSFTFTVRFSSASRENMALGLIPLLRQIASPTLETVSLHVPSTETCSLLQWEEVDEILTGHAFPNLQRVVVRLLPIQIADGDRQLSLSASEDAISSKMVELLRRGRLHFERTDISTRSFSA